MKHDPHKPSHHKTLDTLDLLLAITLLGILTFFYLKLCYMS